MENRIQVSEDLRSVADRLLSRARVASSADDTTSRVMFYNAATEAFGRAWVAANPTAWLFPLSKPSIDPAPKFIYYICMKLQQMGTPVAQLLITGKAAAALFWAAPDDAVEDSADIVGPLPNNTLAADFGVTLSALCARAATITLLGDSIAADGTYNGVVSKGVDFISTISATLSGYCLASDQPVTRNTNGTAVTTGNIWQSDTMGNFVNKYPAPGGGQTQNFPLTPASPMSPSPSARAAERRVV